MKLFNANFKNLFFLNCCLLQIFLFPIFFSSAVDASRNPYHSFVDQIVDSTFKRGVDLWNEKAESVEAPDMKHQKNRMFVKQKIYLFLPFKNLFSEVNRSNDLQDRFAAHWLVLKFCG